VFLTLLVGGATRLTESGLSIVEWKPVTGTMPPLSEGAWLAEFEKYQATTQYQQLNRGMTLAEFKDDLLVGMDTPSARAAHRRGFSVPLCLVSLARMGRARLKWRLWAIFALRRRAGRGGMVDGRFRAGRARQRLAIPACLSSHFGLA
jgi:cytochrome c oxidase assembly protein subunit 15